MAETTGLLNRRTLHGVPRVRISSSPQEPAPGGLISFKKKGNLHLHCDIPSRIAQSDILETAQVVKESDVRQIVGDDAQRSHFPIPDQEVRTCGQPQKRIGFRWCFSPWEEMVLSKTMVEPE